MIFDLANSKSLTPSFFFIRAGLSKGAEANFSLIPKVNLQGFISPNSIIKLLSRSQEQILSEFQLRLNSEISQAIRDQNQPPPGTPGAPGAVPALPPPHLNIPNQ